MGAVVQTIFTCDRCKARVTCAVAHSRPSGWLTLKELRSDRPVPALPNGDIDLCTACVDAFDTWLDNCAEQSDGA